MKYHAIIFIALFVTLSGAFTVDADQGEFGDARHKPAVKELGENRYQIGAIVVDKSKLQFSVPGTVIRHEPPLEFLAVTKGGMKAYESLLELDVSAIEFNLACILIGFDEKNARGALQHFDLSSLSGDKVDSWVSWEQDGKTITVPAVNLLAVEGLKEIPAEWVYTGSMFTPEGQFLAESDGTLIGFVHDPASIIEHRLGLGLGNYGAVAANSAVVPALGTRVQLIVGRR